MALWDKIIGAVDGGLGGVIERVVDRVLPPKLDEAEKAQIKLELMKATAEHETAMMRASIEAENALTERVKALEGTAADLRTVPILGPIMIFMRGSFRPVCCYFTLFWDWKMFSGRWPHQSDEVILMINLLVFGFVFGERAVKNIMPIADRFLERRARAGS